jgi:hypothetical protein
MCSFQFTDLGGLRAVQEVDPDHMISVPRGAEHAAGAERGAQNLSTRVRALHKLLGLRAAKANRKQKIIYAVIISSTLGLGLQRQT